MESNKKAAAQKCFKNGYCRLESFPNADVNDDVNDDDDDDDDDNDDDNVDDDADDDVIDDDDVDDCQNLSEERNTIKQIRQ